MSAVSPLDSFVSIVRFLLLRRAPSAAAGVRDGRLGGCPGTPNCASSASGDVAPIVVAGPPESALDRAAEAIAALPGGRVVERDGRYLRAEFTSRLWRFVDDLELLADPAVGLLHVRAAARVGRNDFGVNRRRVERLRELLAR